MFWTRAHLYGPLSSIPLQCGGGIQMSDGNNFGSTHIKNEHRKDLQ